MVGEQMDKLVCPFIISRKIGYPLYIVGNGTELTLTDVAPVVGEICYKNIIKISTCADSCFAIAGVDCGLM